MSTGARTPGGRKVLVATIRVRIDRRVEWRHVTPLPQLVTAPAAGFFRVQLAVAASKPAGEAPNAREGWSLPRFCEREVEAFLRCGILAHGFLRVWCEARRGAGEL